MLTIYGKENCKFCVEAKNLCDNLGVAYEYNDVQAEEAKMAELKERIPGVRQVPQIFFGDELIGGYTQLRDAVSADQGVVAKWNTPNA